MPRAEAAPRRRVLALLGDAGAPPTSASWRTPSWPSRATRRSSSLAPKDPEAVAALERLYIATGRFADLLAIYDKKLRAGQEQGRGARDPLQARRPLRGGDQAARQGDRALSGDPRRRIPSSCRRWRRSIASISSSSRWKELAATIDAGDRSLDRHGRGRRAEVPARRGPASSTSSDGAGAVASYREALELDPSHVGARTALQAYLSSSDAELQQAAVEVLEPIYEANNDLARLVEVQRIKLAHEKKTDKRVDLLLRIGKLEGQLGNTDQAWEAYTRAVAESPASHGGARGAGEPGQHPRQLAAAGGAVREGAVGQGQGEAAVGAGARAPARRRGRVRREARNSRSTRSSTSAARRASSPRTRRRWWRWSGSTRAPSAGAIWSTRC